MLNESGDYQSKVKSQQNKGCLVGLIISTIGGILGWVLIISIVVLLVQACMEMV